MELEETVARVAGEMRALGYVVNVLITTHPRPDVVRKVFEQTLPDWTDQLSERQQQGSSQAFHEELQARLRGLGELIRVVEQELGERPQSNPGD